MRLWDVSGGGGFWNVRLDVRDLGGHLDFTLRARAAGLHAAEASYVSSSSTSAFRAAVVCAVSSAKMPLARAPAILSLLDGPVGVDPAFHVVWSRFRMMRR